MHALSATKMAANVQPITIPTRVLTGTVIPLPPPSSLTAVDVEEMAGEVVSPVPGIGVDEEEAVDGTDVEVENIEGVWVDLVLVKVLMLENKVEVSVTVISSSDRLLVTTKVVVMPAGMVEVTVRIVSLSDWPRAERGQTTGVLQGSRLQQPLYDGVVQVQMYQKYPLSHSLVDEASALVCVDSMAIRSLRLRSTLVAIALHLWKTRTLR
jgi:hypothetical protein